MDTKDLGLIYAGERLFNSTKESRLWRETLDRPPTLRESMVRIMALHERAFLQDLLAEEGRLNERERAIAEKALASPVCATCGGKGGVFCGGPVD